MKKNYASLVCPYCNGKYGNNITCKLKEETEKEEKENCTIIHIKRDYKCYCDDCNKEYSVDYGQAKLIRYYPFKTLPDSAIKLYVEYESEFDNSYTIMEKNGITMITMENDDEPIILDNTNKEDMIEDHEQTKSLTNKTWMARHR